MATTTNKIISQVNIGNNLYDIAAKYDASNKNGVTKVFELSKNASIKFMHWIYSDAEMYMKRHMK